MSMQPHVEEVGRAALPKMMETIRAVVKGASFVAFDTELSGLSALLEKPSLMDSVAQRYIQLRDSAQSFGIVQFGMSCFTWKADVRAFEVRTFQFPIFPGFPASTDTRSLRDLPDRSFLSQAKCLTYVRDHGFDLNHWVDEGIGYLSHAEQEKLKPLLTRSLREDVHAKFRGDSSAAARSAENERFLSDMGKRVSTLVGLVEGLTPPTENEELVDDEAAAQLFVQEPLTNRRPFVHRNAAGGVRCALVTDPQAPFRRYALMAMVEARFPTVLVLDCPADNDDDKDVKATPWKRRLRLIATRNEAEKATLRRAHESVLRREHELHNLSLVGFTSVIDVLMDTTNRTPIIGHNMMLDLLQCYDKFHGELPESCSAFVHKLAEWLDGASLFDTKVMVEHAMETIDLFGEKLEHSGLEYVYECVTKDPFSGPSLRDANPKGSSPSGSKRTPKLSAHQAGYDAFMTGAVFLRVCSGLHVPNEAIASLDGMRKDRNDVPTWQEVILQLRNQFAVSRTLPPVVLKLPGPFPAEVKTPSRDNFLRMTLTRAWLPKVKAFHIKQTVNWALGLRSTNRVKIRYESQSVVFIELPGREHVDNLMKIRQECPDVHGSDKDPLPSLGCVELVRCEDFMDGSSTAGFHEADEAVEPKLKRHRTMPDDAK